MSDVLTYIDFNTSDLVKPQLGLRTVLFHSLELLSSNHLELVSKLCPNVEWLSLDSALFYNLEGLSRLPQLRLLRLNYKGRPIDDTVIDFFKLSCDQLTTLHLFDVKELSIEDLRYVKIYFEFTISQFHKKRVKLKYVEPKNRNGSSINHEGSF